MQQRGYADRPSDSVRLVSRRPSWWGCLRPFAAVATLLTIGTSGASCWAVGDAGSWLTAVERLQTDDFNALVWLGKSCFAELHNRVRAALHVLYVHLQRGKGAAFSSLTPLRSSTDCWRSLTSEQYAGLSLPPHPAATNTAAASANMTQSNLDIVHLQNRGRSTAACLGEHRRRHHPHRMISCHHKRANPRPGNSSGVVILARVSTLASACGVARSHAAASAR